jgi:hypothetical protein
MCASVCPSQALFFGTREQIEQLRPLSMPVNHFQFGNQTISTEVFMMVPRAAAVTPRQYVDITAAMDERPRGQAVSLNVLGSTRSAVPPQSAESAMGFDPFAEVEV